MFEVVFVDTETHLIRPGLPFPPLVCVSYAYRSLVGEIRRGLFAREEGLSAFRGWLEDKNKRIVFHNTRFDLGVFMAADPMLIPLIFEALAEDRISCTLVREKLVKNYSGDLNSTPGSDLKHGRVGPYTLASLVDRYWDTDISEGKTTTSWRLRFKELDGVPLSQWPDEAANYAVEDAGWALEVYEAQEVVCRHLDHGLKILADEYRRTRADVALGLMSGWGIMIDGARVTRVCEQLMAKVRRGTEIMAELGLLRDTGTINTLALREMVAAAYASQRAKIPKTPKGSVKTDRDALLGSGNPLLAEYAHLGKYRTLLRTFIPAVRLAPGIPLHPYYNVMVATGRTSASRPNVQNVPRDTGDVGIRECFVPREGRVFVACDYDTAELRTLAQVLLDKVGFSTLAEAYQADINLDPHTMFAIELVGGHGAWDKLSPEEKKLNRTRAKAASFGFPGGLGIRTFIGFAQGYGLTLTEDEAKELRKKFLDKWAAIRKYFNLNSVSLSPKHEALVEHKRSGRFRGRCTFTQLCNTPFQGMAASGALSALFKVVYEMYAVPDSPLFGSRPSLFIHDEIVISTPEPLVHPAAMRLRELMIEGMEEFTPDVPAQATPVAMRRWSKDAKPAFDDEGRLIPWEDYNGEHRSFRASQGS